jgi:hypothetical protein
MKKTLLVAALVTLTTSAFAGSAMDFNISDSPSPAAPVRSTAVVSAKPVTAVSGQASGLATNTAGARDPVVTMPSSAPAAVSSNASRNTTNAKVSARPGRSAAADAASAPQAASAAAVDTPDNGIPTLDAATGNAVNPFTGKSLNEEDLQRQLEASKARTSLLEEQLKQVTITADIANVPLKKRAEVAKLELPAPPVAASAPVQPKPVKKRPVKKATPAVEVVAPKMPNVRLDGVVVNEGVASAILDVDGNSSVVANGGSTPFGPVKVLNATSAMVGGMALHVSEETTIARVHISDPKPVDPKERTALPVLNVPGASGAVTTTAGRPLPPVPLPPPTNAAMTTVQ